VLVFTALMGLAIIAMTFVMRARGLPAPLGIVPVVGALVLCSMWFAVRLLVDVRDDELASAESAATVSGPGLGAGAIPTPDGRFR
jgi:hypothetical protein